MSTEADFNYHKHYHDAGIVRCILMVSRRVAFTYTPLKWAGKQIGEMSYPNGERLPIHAVRGMEGDSYEALGRLRQRHQPHFQEAGV